MKKAIIFGATGLVGEALIKELSNGFYDEVLVIVRKSSKTLNHLVQEKPSLFKVAELDNLMNFEFELNQYGDYLNADLYCALGTTLKTAKTKENFRKIDHDLVVNLIAKAKKYGAINLALVSSAGADPQSSIFYSKVKGEVEMAVKQLKFDHCFILRPSLLLGDRDEFRLGEKIMRDLAIIYSPLMIGPLAQYRPIKASTVARCMISLMKRLFENQAYNSRVIENREIQTIGEDSLLE